MDTQIAIPGLSWEDSISPCGLYRWVLRSPPAPGQPVVCFVLCNPSTATKHKTDRTTESCLRLARAWGAGQIVLVNLFAYRSTSPQALEWVIKHDGVAKGVGAGNGERIRRAAKSADKVVVGWGSILKPWSTERGEQVRLDLEGIESGLWCLGKNFDGAPRRPLYVASGTKLERWS